MKEKITVINTLIDHVEDYAKTTYELYKLKGIKKISTVVSTIITSVLFFLITILLLITLSIGFSLYLGEVLGKSHYGFMAVAGIYALILVILLVVRKSFIEATFSNMMIKTFFKDKDDANN